MSETKTCRICGETKPLSEFHRSTTAPDGRQYRCKPCAIADARRRALANPEAKREADRRYERSEKRRRSSARHRAANRDKINAQKRASYERNREANLERQRAYRERPEYAEEQRARYARWRERNPRGVHRQAIRKTYGLSLEEFDGLVLAQEGRCFICSDPLRDPNIDHCHTSGKVRALLCHLCNRGLGLFRDNPDHLAAALDYLRAHAPVPPTQQSP